VEESPLARRTANVVPRLVEQSAAPAAKHCKLEAPAKLDNMKDKPIGAPIPVAATATESVMLAFSDWNEVESPPGMA